MKDLVRSINKKLETIIIDLQNSKEELVASLAGIQDKIDEKIEEARSYKIEVDNYKNSIKSLEMEIDGLEQDLNELTMKFSKKDLNAILETANKEINMQIVSRKSSINKNREMINELTEKARMIKDLLINLKKEKENKSESLTNVTSALEYYEKELNRIIEFSENNADNLIIEDSSESAMSVNQEEIEQAYEEVKEIDGGPVFEEIKSIEEEVKEDNDSFASDSEYVSRDFDSVSEDIDEEDAKFDFDAVNVDEAAEEIDLKEASDDLNAVSNAENDTEFVSLFEHDKTQKIDFKTLNDSINQEYSNIFGKSLEEEENTFGYKNIYDIEPNESDSNIFDSNQEEDHSGLTQTDIFNVHLENETLKESDNIENFFKEKGLDFSYFIAEDQNYLRNNFNKDNYSKVVDVLRNNNINIQNIYGAARIFEMPSTELESIISKLLLANQTTDNIGLVLNALPLINSAVLNEVLQTYGNGKQVDITDIILNAIHLKNEGGK